MRSDRLTCGMTGCSPTVRLERLKDKEPVPSWGQGSIAGDHSVCGFSDSFLEKCKEHLAGLFSCTRLCGTGQIEIKGSGEDARRLNYD